MNPCHPFTADLDLLAAGVLPPDRSRGAETHLAGCAACRARYALTLALCAGLSAAGKAADPPDAAAWRLRNRARQALLGTPTGAGRRWHWAAATATAVAVACGALCFHRTPPPILAPSPAEAAVDPPTAPDPPLTLLACERAAACSDAALEQILSRDAARPCRPPGEQTLRAFSPSAFAALDQNNRLP